MSFARFDGRCRFMCSSALLDAEGWADIGVCGCSESSCATPFDASAVYACGRPSLLGQPTICQNPTEHTRLPGINLRQAVPYRHGFKKQGIGSSGVVARRRMICGVAAADPIAIRADLAGNSAARSMLAPSTVRSIGSSSRSITIARPVFPAMESVQFQQGTRADRAY